MTNDGVNVPLLRKAVEFAEASAALQRPFEDDPEDLDPEDLNPETDPNNQVWYQGNWAQTKVSTVTDPEQATLEHCGTAYCIAGYVSSLQPGYEVRVETIDLEDGRYAVGLVETIDGTRFTHLDVARDALGLTAREANALFDGGNSIAAVRRAAEEIAGERL